ncbi:MAG: acyl carrier protein [Desulfuromonas sp.]|uniref:phosphopantetheine-binding protein n=1 Tax=Desulfuromonas sp. TaxID=892 RepID=UPI000CC27995|nr:phosphopantetheine-binding protein [Desulfuromonas sp.]PLX82012.1 MAG: acyl carrier protein [Desulfuromonas sp.]
MKGTEREVIRDFIITKIAKNSEHREIADHDDIIEKGMIDSLGIMHLIGYLETTFEMKIGDDEILPENFTSVEAITSFVTQSR